MSSDENGGFRHLVKTMLSHHHGARHGQAVAAEVFQTSTIAALLDGIYDGDVTIAELLTHGDFGLGTFNHLDGEMVVLNGVCHHLRSDGGASVAAPDDRTPFAAVTWFKPETTIAVSATTGRSEIVALIDRRVPPALHQPGAHQGRPLARLRADRGPDSDQHLVGTAPQPAAHPGVPGREHVAGERRGADPPDRRQLTSRCPKRPSATGWTSGRRPGRILGRE